MGSELRLRLGVGEAVVVFAEGKPSGSRVGMGMGMMIGVMVVLVLVWGGKEGRARVARERMLGSEMLRLGRGIVVGGMGSGCPIVMVGREVLRLMEG